MSEKPCYETVAVQSIAEWLAGLDKPDDLIHNQAVSLYVHAFTYNGLTAAPCPDLLPEPTVAEEWEIVWTDFKIAVVATLAAFVRFCASKLSPTSSTGSTKRS